MSPDEYRQQKAARAVFRNSTIAFLFSASKRKTQGHHRASTPFAARVDDVEAIDRSDDRAARTKLIWWRNAVQTMLRETPRSQSRPQMLRHAAREQSYRNS